MSESSAPDFWSEQSEGVGLSRTLLRLILLAATSAVASVVFATIALVFGALPGVAAAGTDADRFWFLAISVYLLSGPVTVLLLIVARRDPRPRWDTAFALSALSSGSLLVLGYWVIWPMWNNMLIGSIWCLVLSILGIGAHAAALRFEAIGVATPLRGS